MTTPIDAGPKDHLIISVPLAQAVADYLSRRPYNEVFLLIDGLKELKPMTADKNTMPIGDYRID